MRLALFRCSHFVAKCFATSLYTWRVVSLFQDDIYTIKYVPLLNGN